MFKSILVPIDVEQPSSWKSVLPEALELARESSGKITSVAVIKGGQFMAPGAGFPTHVEAQVDKTCDRLCSVIKPYQGEIEINHDIRIGRIGPQILEAAEACDADLILMASHRPEMKDYLIGPNAVHVVRHSPRSVLILRKFD